MLEVYLTQVLSRHRFRSINPDLGPPTNQRGQPFHKGPRFRHRKMGSNGSLISPLLVKKQPVRILAIRMDMVRETARFGARPGAMLGAQGDDVRASVSRDSK